MKATALIAEDEPLLAQALRAELARAWPELEVLASVADGASAVREALRLLPQILLLDIRMPGLDGLAAAAELADQWPVDEAPLPQLVFVTAYDEYAMRAFELAAVDYVQKPVQPERLRRTVGRLQQALAAQQPMQPLQPLQEPHSTRRDDLARQAAVLDETLAQWRRLLSAAGAAAAPSPDATSTSPAGALPDQPATPLQFIAASDAGGATVRMVPIEEVQYFEAADKYVRVLTSDHEYLIRTPLKQLLPQLDAKVFWQVHRAVVVRSSAIESVHRDESGKQHLSLRGRPERIPVSRLYAHLFRAM